MKPRKKPTSSVNKITNDKDFTDLETKLMREYIEVGDFSDITVTLESFLNTDGFRDTPQLLDYPKEYSHTTQSGIRVYKSKRFSMQIERISVNTQETELLFESYKSRQIGNVLHVEGTKTSADIIEINSKLETIVSKLDEIQHIRELIRTEDIRIDESLSTLYLGDNIKLDFSRGRIQRDILGVLFGNRSNNDAIWDSTSILDIYGFDVSPSSLINGTEKINRRVKDATQKNMNLITIYRKDKAIQLNSDF